MPTARVLTFGYNSKTYFSRSESDIPDFASELLYALKSQRISEEERQRRIVFICHSLGGLVFKQAVIMAHEQDRHYSCILDHIHGVVFLGTPHRGSSLATWDEIGTLVVKASTLGYSSNSKLSSSLKVDSKFLRRITESFAARGEDFEVRSFYETKRMKGLNCQVVEKESAKLNWPKELSISSNANHSDICKFPSPEDSRYKLASQAIREEAGELASGTDVLLDPLAMACLRELNSAYEYHLDQIDNPISKTCEWFTSHTQWNRWDSLPGSGLLWITADAGCGKSVLAKYLVNFFRERTSRAHLHTHVCYFFFKEGLEHQDNAPSAVSAILHQLFSNQRRLMHHAMAKYSNMPKNSFNRFSTLWCILLAMMEDPQTKDVLDGLDECEDKSLEELIKALADFVQSRKTIPNKARPACKIILLSRHLNSIERRFGLRPSIGSHDAGAQSSEGCVNFRLSAEEESASVAKDIAQFVASRISDLGRQSEISTEILHRIEKRLISSADCTFLWVSLVMNIVKGAEVDGISMGQIEAILATTKLEDVYEKLLSGRASPLKSRKVLLLILSAVRPLTVEELCGAVEVNQDYHQQQDTKESERVMAHLESISLHELGQRKEVSRAQDLIARSGRITTSTNMMQKLENNERRAMRAISLRPGANHDRLSRQPEVQTRTLQHHMHRPFINHIRQVCGHLVRIRKGKIYLVHQTARQFLLHQRRELGFGAISQGKKYSLPTHRDRQESGSSTLVSQWQHSISLADANLYMLQICADYLDLFRSAKAFKKAALTKQEANVYLKDCRKDCRKDPPRAFLRYVSRHWLDHYRPIREDLKLSYDYLLQPNTPQFNAWIISHGSWMPEEQRRILEIGGVSIIKEEEEELSMPMGLPYQAGHGRVKTRQADANIGPLEKRERELQAALQHFNLIGREIDIYDEEFLDGRRYWKGKDYIESGDASTSDEDEEAGMDMKESKATVPDRMQYYRQQQSRRVMRIIEEGRVSTSASMANPTSSRSWLA
ncbi:hypothetical protein BDP81DRAFT_317718 [Colletotrichum phormii]|uniref:Protein SERAC1 n=1 Tax=Colletotrichum phormii TaxID=359342 RepID=A0AAJ0EFY1_9PEZI|nr:uncharacterized protein BDP81DRAFT_317718 [Colletotrichum phormii]KAK1637464.1 hypothetical protein BDP81DRAFT_317718 [Colletotrichum phormii]